MKFPSSPCFRHKEFGLLVSILLALSHPFANQTTPDRLLAETSHTHITMHALLGSKYLQCLM